MQLHFKANNHCDKKTLKYQTALHVGVIALDMFTCVTCYLPFWIDTCELQGLFKGKLI